MTETTPPTERLRADLVLEYPFTRTTGRVIGAFLTGLREQMILGIKRTDGSVLCPPTEYDPETAEPLSEMVEVGPGGTIETWTWVEKPRVQSPWESSHALAMIRLDGADTAMLHGVLVDTKSDIESGMRVAATWRSEREGHIADLAGFVPEQEDGGATHE